MKKIYAALTALMLCLIAIPLAVFSAESSGSTYELKDAGRGFFVGGNAHVGTNVPRTWRNTAGVEITLNGVTTNRQQQFALADDNSLLMNGIFTLTVPSGVTVTEAEITFFAPNGGNPVLRFPSSAANVTVTSTDSDAPQTVKYTFDSAVKSFDFEIAGNQRIQVKSIKLIHTGTIRQDANTSISATGSAPRASEAPANGQFDPKTRWFAMIIGAQGYVISNPDGAGYIALNNAELEAADQNVWCMVGNESDGYLIYNREAGTDLLLAAPKDLSANTGGNAYVCMKAPGDDNYSYRWNFAASTALTGKTAYFMYQQGVASAKVNNRQGKLAFWTTGADTGSSIQFLACYGVPTDGSPITGGSTVDPSPSGGISISSTTAQFTPTTVTDGVFASNTKWYGLTVAESKFVLTDNGTAQWISTSTQDAAFANAERELWCVTGNDTDGYTIYNKEAGSSKALGIPNEISGDGGSTYPVLRDITDSSYSFKWDLKNSNALPGTGYYFIKHGTTDVAINRRGDKLAIWKGFSGVDKGSTIQFYPATVSEGSQGGDNKSEVTINATAANGTGIVQGTSAFFCEWRSNDNIVPTFTIITGGRKNNMKMANGHIVAYVGQDEAGKTYTVSAGSSHYISSIKMSVKDFDADGSVSIEMGGKSITPSQTAQALEASFAEGTPATFKLNGANKGIEFVKLEITATPNGMAPGENPGTEPGTEGAISLEVNKGEKVSATANSANYCRGWRSNTNPVVTLMCDADKNNMDRRTTDHFLLHSGLNTASAGWTISVPDGYVITDLSMDYRQHGSAASTITLGGKSYTGTAADQKITLTGNNSNEVKFTAADNNGGVELRNVTVTVKSGSGEPVGPGPDEPEEGFKTTTLVNGNFAEDTPWYVLTIGATDLTIADNGDEDYIALGTNDLSTADNMLWCVTGNETDGYTLYNKAAGTTKSLAAPIEMMGVTGAESYAILKAPGDEDYCYKWDITTSTSLSSKTSYYFAQHGESAKKLNNRGGKLAFWTGGADAGSSIRFIAKDDVPVRPEKLEAPYIFPYTGEGFYSIQYRIPSISVVGAGKHAGRIIAFNDYRYSGADIGMGSNGRIDQHMTYSDDGGLTWSYPAVLRDAEGNAVSQGKGTHPQKTDPYEYADNAFSDPCSVADRESGRVLLMSCAGPMGFWSSRRNSPQLVARWYSEDGGDTWSAPDYDVTEQLFRPLDGKAYNGQGADGFFIGSGKIHQSRHVKVDKYYRLYMAISTHCQGSNTKNYVYYSDDFGGNWKLLGDAAKGAIDSNGDEPKVEELPDGSVAIIARGNGGNRNYNIFTFTDIKGGYGSWGDHVNRNILGSNLNACNGEPMMVPAVNKATGKKCYVLLQSVPFGPGRANVGIAYKEISSLDHCGTPAALGENWLGKLQVSSMGSAYSTMAQMTDGNIAFLYEEETHGRAYTGVFRKLSLSEITGGKYEYTPDPDGAISEELAEGMDLLYAQKKALYEPWLTMEAGTLVGQPTAATIARIRPLAQAYLDSRDLADLKTLEDALVTTEIIGITDGVKYRLTNVERKPARYLTVNASSQLEGTAEESDACDFEFVPVDPAARSAAALDRFFLRHVKTGLYAAATGANETRINMVETADEAAVYSALMTTDGRTAIICTQPTGGNNALHLAGDNTRVVPWTAAETSPASRWYVAPENADDAIVTGIENVTVNPAGDDDAIYDLYGRRVTATRPGQLYISKGRKFIAL